MTEKLIVRNVYKIFGNEPRRALELMEQGLDKAEVLEKTGLTIGVRDASFEVMSGEIFVVMGLSGSGKSTLIRMLNRLIDPTAGEVWMEDQNITAMSRKKLVALRRDHMSMVFQSFALMPHLTVLGNTAYALDVAGVSKKKQESRAMDALDQVGLKAYADSYPAELSGGMQQRVGLARALAQDPAILLMDEAFSALDPLIRAEMQDELLKLQDQSQRTVVFISHDLHEAMKLGDRIAMMEGGRIVQIGTPDEILKNPADKYVQSFFRGVDPTTVFRTGDIARDTQVTLFRHKGEGPRAFLEQLQKEDREFGYVLDRQKRYKGVVSADSLKRLIEEEDGDLQRAFLKDVEPLDADTPLQEALPVIRKYGCPVPLVDDRGRYIGVVSKNAFLRTLEEGIRREQEQTETEDQKTLEKQQAAENA